MTETYEPFVRLGIKALFLVWGPPRGSRRSELIAQRLGMDCRRIYLGTRQGKYWAIFKYAYQLLATLLLLARHPYRVVIIQDPPIFAVLPVYFFSLLGRVKFIIDAHTPPLLSPIWAWTLPLHRFLSRRAITTLVTNSYLRDLVAAWEAPAFVLEDPPMQPAIYAPAHLRDDAFNVVVVSTASPDEPIDQILQAARSLPDTQFYITGNFDGSFRGLIDAAPPNVCFTGYLGENYFSLLGAADAVMDLCVEDYQFLSGANEALWLGKPIITSQGPVLENYFSKGTIHIGNTAGQICEAVKTMQAHLPMFQAGIRELQEERRREWQQKCQTLIGLVQQALLECQLPASLSSTGVTGR